MNFRISEDLKKKISWNPQFIMTKIVELFINYSKYETFQIQVIKDQRSYDHQLFISSAQKLN